MSAEFEGTYRDCSEAPVFRREALTVYSLLSKPESPEISIALIIVNGENEKTVNTTTDARYYILSGIGYFTLCDGSYPKVIPVRSGDIVHIPKGTVYHDVGADLVMVSVNHPAFNPDAVKHLGR